MPDAPGESLGRIRPAMPQRPDHAGRNLVLAACLIATFMAAVESTIIATIIPTIVGDLGGFTLFTWVFTVYLLTQAVTIPVYGRLADIYGRKPIFFIGATIFLVGTGLCGAAWSIPSLIAFRAIQGCGAGAIQPIAATILGDIYTPQERGRIQGLVSSVFGVSAVIGPSLGAFLVEHVSWRVTFWVNIPIGLAAIVMIALFLHETVEHRQHKIDWIGGLLLLTVFATLMPAMVEGGRLAPPALALLLLAGVIALVALYANEKTTDEPMLPLELWRHNRVVLVGSLGNFTSGAMMMGICAFLPTYVQGAMGRTAIMGGLVLGAMSVSWALFSIIAGRLMGRTSYRTVAIAGASAMVTGCVILLLASPSDGIVPAAIGSFVIGIGMGFCSSVFIVAIQASVLWGQRAAATSSSMFMRFVGQSVGASAGGAVLNATLRYLSPESSHTVDRLLDPATRSALGAGELDHLIGILAASVQNAYLLATAFAALTLMITFRLPARLSPTRR